MTLSCKQPEAVSPTGLSRQKIEDDQLCAEQVCKFPFFFVPIFRCRLHAALLLKLLQMQRGRLSPTMLARVVVAFFCLLVAVKQVGGRKPMILSTASSNFI